MNKKRQQHPRRATVRPSWKVTSDGHTQVGQTYPPLHSTRLLGPTGQAMSIVQIHREGEVECRVDTLALAPRYDFSLCQLCLVPVRGTEEHVPPENIGGTVMTRICSDCNNKAGGRTEPEFEDWWNDVLVRAKFLSESGFVRGSRNAAKLYRRQTSDGVPVLALDDRHDPDVGDNS